MRAPEMDTSLTLLQSLQSPDESESWQVLNHLYGPMIQKWLARNDIRVDDQDDVVQEVLLRVADMVEQFEHSGQPGAFRNWLKRITINCLRNFRRKSAKRPKSMGGTDFEEFLGKWADPASQVSRVWRIEYQQSVIHYLLAVVKKRFRENVFQAFYQTTILDRDVTDVAAELDMSAAAIYTARSRVLKEIRSLKQGIAEDEF